MTLTFENEQDFDLGFDPEEVAAAVINGVLDQEACPYEAEVELILTDPENIRTMNREHRNIDRETDVLSFPMVDYPSPASFDFLETEEGDDCFNPDSGELMLGDIVISVARARAQAEEILQTAREQAEELYSGISGFNVQYVKVCADTDGKYYISVTASMNDSDGLSFMDSFRYDIG